MVVFQIRTKHRRFYALELYSLYKNAPECDSSRNCFRRNELRVVEQVLIRGFFMPTRKAAAARVWRKNDEGNEKDKSRWWALVLK